MTRNELSVQERKIAAEVLQYLLRNQSAQDTLDGIATWWIESQRVHQAIEEVSTAIEFLISLDLVVVNEVPGQARYYRFNTSLSAKANELITALKPNVRL